MLKACFVGTVGPQGAENMLIKCKAGSYISRQSDYDPDLLLLSYVANDIKPCVKHVIVPEFHASISVKSAVFRRRLQDESEEVEKFLESFGCKFPLPSDFESQPTSFKKRTKLEDGDLHRCAVCTFESEDVKKAQKHRNNHRVGSCSTCDSYLLQKNLSNHTQKCKTVQLHYCDHEKKCDFSSPHKWMVTKHVKQVHCKPLPCQECGKSFRSPEQLECHMKRHKQTKKYKCSECDETFESKSSKYRHMNNVHVNPTIKISSGFMRLASVSLGDKYKQRGRKVHYCSDCGYKTTNKTHLQNHQRKHLNVSKKVRPDRYKCVTTCTYQNKERYKVKRHMKTCRRYLLTTDHYRPKGMVTNERVCLLQSKIDISNKKMKLIMKEMADCVGKELMDYNLREALSDSLNSTADFYYSKEIKFTNSKGEERFTSFVCLKDLKAMVEEIMRRRGVTRVLVVIALDGGQDKLVATLAVFDLDTLDELTDTGFSVGGRKQIFLVACAANVPENRTMVKLFFKEMKVKDLIYPFILAADEKMKNLIFGKV